MSTLKETYVFCEGFGAGRAIGPAPEVEVTAERLSIRFPAAADGWFAADGERGDDAAKQISNFVYEWLLANADERYKLKMFP